MVKSLMTRISMLLVAIAAGCESTPALGGPGHSRLIYEREGISVRAFTITDPDELSCRRMLKGEPADDSAAITPAEYWLFMINTDGDSDRWKSIEVRLGDGTPIMLATVTRQWMESRRPVAGEYQPGSIASRGLANWVEHFEDWGTYSFYGATFNFWDQTLTDISLSPELLAHTPDQVWLIDHATGRTLAGQPTEADLAAMFGESMVLRTTPESKP